MWYFRKTPFMPPVTLRWISCNIENRWKWSRGVICNWKGLNIDTKWGIQEKLAQSILPGTPGEICEIKKKSENGLVGKTNWITKIIDLDPIFSIVFYSKTIAKKDVIALFSYKQPERDLSFKTCLNFSRFLRSKLLKIPLVLVNLTRKQLKKA